MILIAWVLTMTRRLYGIVSDNVNMSRDSQELNDLWYKTKTFYYFVALMREEQDHPTYEAELSTRILCAIALSLSLLHCIHSSF
jgi:hypothetical protein